MRAQLIHDREAERAAAAAERRAEFDRQTESQRQEIAEREVLGASIRSKFEAQNNARSSYKKTGLQKLIHAFCGISNDQLSRDKLIDQVSFACSSDLKEYLTRDQIAAHTFAKNLVPIKSAEFHQTFERCCEVAGCQMPVRYPGQHKLTQKAAQKIDITLPVEPVVVERSGKDQLIKALSPVFTTDEINTIMLQMRVDNIDAVSAVRKAVRHKLTHISRSRAEEMIMAALNIEGKIT